MICNELSGRGIGVIMWSHNKIASRDELQRTFMSSTATDVAVFLGSLQLLASNRPYLAEIAYKERLE